jgi:hypothetical protein
MRAELAQAENHRRSSFLTSAELQEEIRVMPEQVATAQREALQHGTEAPTLRRRVEQLAP